MRQIDAHHGAIYIATHATTFYPIDTDIECESTISSHAGESMHSKCNSTDHTEWTTMAIGSPLGYPYEPAAVYTTKARLYMLRCLCTKARLHTLRCLCTKARLHTLRCLCTKVRLYTLRCLCTKARLYTLRCLCTKARLYTLRCLCTKARLYTPRCLSPRRYESCCGVCTPMLYEYAAVSTPKLYENRTEVSSILAPKYCGRRCL